VFFLASAFADDGTTGSAQIAASGLQTPAISVVASKTVNAGDHKVTFVRILPPALPRLPAPTVPPTSAADQALVQERAGKSFVQVSFSAAIFPGPVTALSWQRGGQTYHAYSNVDFRLLSNVPEIETANAVYSLVFSPMIGDPTSGPAAERLAATSQFSPGHAQLVLANSAASPAPGDPTPPAFAALLAYYDQNQAGLQSDYARRQEEQAAHQLQAHPTTTPDSTVFFWPIKSQQNPP
jgi:hypothetical protein